MNCGSQVSIRQDPSGNIIITVDGTSYDIGPRTNIPEVACAVDGSGIFIDGVLCEFPSNAEGLASVQLDRTTLNFERVSADPLSVDLSSIQGDKLPDAETGQIFQQDGSDVTADYIRPVNYILETQSGTDWTTPPAFIDALFTFGFSQNNGTGASKVFFTPWPDTVSSLPQSPLYFDNKFLLSQSAIDPTHIEAEPVVIASDFSVDPLIGRPPTRDNRGLFLVGNAQNGPDVLNLQTADDRYVIAPPTGTNGVFVNTDTGLEVRAPMLYELTGAALPGSGSYLVIYDGSTGLSYDPLLLTAQSTMWSVPVRDGSGSFKVGTPLAADDAANKAYVDGMLPAGTANQTIVWDTAANGGLGGYVDGLLRRGSVSTATVTPNNNFIVGFAAAAAPSDTLRPMAVTRDATANTVVARDINSNFRAAPASNNADVVILQQLNSRMSANARSAVNGTQPLNTSATLADVITAYNALLSALKQT